jgi:hypothetical protein
MYNKMEANQYQKLYRSLSNSGGEVRKAGDWDEFFEPAYYSPVFPGDIPSEIPEFTTSELGIDHPMDTFNKEVPQYFVLVIDNVDEFENGEVFVDTQGYEYVRYGYGIKKPEPMEELEQTEEAYHIGDNKEIIKKEMKEAKGSITGPEWNQMSKEDKTELLKKHFPKLSLKFADWKWNDLTPMIKNKLTGKVVNEGYYGTSNVENHIQAIGYDSFEDFFNDNPGGEEALISWIESIPEFRKMLMQQGMMEAKKDKVELDEYFINKMKFRAGIIK